MDLELIFKRIKLILFLTLFFIFFPFTLWASNNFLVLCYHDILLDSAPKTAYDVSRKHFVQQLEYLKTHGYSIVSPKDIILAAKKEKPLPKKAVMLTFDDGYISFYKFVYPILKMYNYPAVIGIVPSWINRKPPSLSGKKLMSWEQIKELSRSKLIYIASHTYNLHKGIVYTPQGNIGPAGNHFKWNTNSKTYETEVEFRKRIRDDLEQSVKILMQKTGYKPYIVVWPYGEYNAMAVHEAKKSGFKMMLATTNGYASLNRLYAVNRNFIERELTPSDFAKEILTGFSDQKSEGFIRAAQIDLDNIVNPNSYKESDKNLGILIERLLSLGVNTVFIQAFCDTDGTGDIHSVYFYNHVLPVKMDFLGHAINRIQAKGIMVYAWMPVLGFVLPNAALERKLMVKEFKNGRIRPTSSWYKRLSPFNKKTLEIVESLYRDLSAYTQIDGILFQDDAYLSDTEDFNSAAIKVYREKFGNNVTPKLLLQDQQLESRWANLKTDRINQFIEKLMKTVKQYRPEAKFARNIYAEAVTDPSAYEWFAQKFGDYLKDYDYTVIMAYPQMEMIKSKKDWFEKIVKKIKIHPKAINKCILKVQSYNWKKEKWLDELTLKKELRFLVSLGVKHIAYYPDDAVNNKPCADRIKSITSAKIFPFEVRQ